MASKLGWQFQNVTGWASSIVNSKFAKIIDPPQDNPLPGVEHVIGRIYIPDSESNAMIMRGTSGASEWVNRFADTMVSRRYVYAWELPNEPQPVSNWEFCKKLAEFTKTAAIIMKDLGLRSIGGNLSEGNPGGDTDNERANLFCAIAEGLGYCDFWSQHAYWVPDDYPHQEAGYNKWHALRYQMNREYATARGMHLPPVLLTEGGWDFGIVSRPKYGWRSYADWPTYFNDLRRLDADLQRDDNVVGCTLFVSGSNNDWADFEIGEVESMVLRSYIAAQGNISVPTPEQPKVMIGRPLPPGKGSVSQPFGADIKTYGELGFAGHEGLDYKVAAGTPALACADGRVKYAGNSTGANKPYGRRIVIDHGKWESWYAHLSVIAVDVNDNIKQGQVIGYTGNTGNTTGAHLHFAIRVPTAKNGSKGFVDPWALRVILGDA